MLKATYLTPLEGVVLDDKSFMVTKPFIVSFSPGIKLKNDFRRVQLRVPSEFITDFASVPRLPVVWLLTGDRARRAAVVHDYLCSLKTCTYQEAAKAFEACMREEKVSWWRRWAMTKAVLWFGPRF